MGFSFGKLFGHGKEAAAATPEQCFINLYEKVKKGDLETMVTVSGFSAITPEMLKKTNGIVKGHIQKYLVKILEKTQLQAQILADNGETVTLQVTGDAADLAALITQYRQRLDEMESELGLRTKQQMDMRKVGMLAGALDECIAQVGTVPVTEELVVENQSGAWVIGDETALSKAFLGIHTQDLEQKFSEVFGDLAQAVT